MSSLKIILFSLVACLSLSTQAAERPNVVPIVCDDLNDYVTGFGGHPQARTRATLCVLLSCQESTAQSAMPPTAEYLYCIAEDD